MNIQEANKKIEYIGEKLIEMQKIAYISREDLTPDQETGIPKLEGGLNMVEFDPLRNAKIQLLWEEIKKTVPSGFDIDGNLVRHLTFNQAHDWYDISNWDIPRELTKVEEYKKKLFLVEYLSGLHPEVGRVHETVLNGDIEMALKGVYANLDTKIRSLLKISGSDSTVSYIGKAFKDGTLIPPRPENLQGSRDFLMGVIGYYRNAILHNPITQRRNSIESSLSLFALAHEAFILFEVCSRNIK